MNLPGFVPQLFERVRPLPNLSESTDIYYVVDNLGWVQEKRINYLSKYLKHFSFQLLTRNQFARLWNKGRLFGRPVYFASWRIPYGISDSSQCHFDSTDFDCFMTSVTSHYNIGGGLLPSKALPQGAVPQEAFEIAILFLQPFRVITANSRILFDLLSPHLPQLNYAPNGVDGECFFPADYKAYNPSRIRIGWVGKIKAAKNYEVVEAASQQLEKQRFTVELKGVTKNNKIHDIWNEKEMLDFYHRIDYYLNASWHEGTPNPALEAAACGVPVVTTRVGNMLDIVVHAKNGFFVEPTVNSIVKQFENINQITEDNYYLLSSNIRNSIVKDWTWDKSMINYKVAFERLLDGV
jgi:glycosyltransferase involved in cell wall biosynthesis